MRVNGIDLLEEVLAMFCQFGDKGVIHIPKPQPGWIGGSADGLGFKLYHEQAG